MRIITPLSMFIVISSTLALNSTLPFEGKIVNGINPYNQNFLEMVPDFAILAKLKDRNDRHYCSGVAIDPQRVLTTRYCIESQALKSNQSKEFDCSAITVFISDHRYDIGCFQVCSKPSGTRGKYFDDIGLITLKFRILNYIIEWPIIERRPVSVGNDVALLGWHKNTSKGYSVLSLKVIGEGNICIEKDNVTRKTTKIFCAAYTSVNNFGYISEGDIGSPLFRNKRLIGIVSEMYPVTLQDFGILFGSIPGNWKYIGNALIKSNLYLNVCQSDVVRTSENRMEREARDENVPAKLADFFIFKRNSPEWRKSLRISHATGFYVETTKRSKVGKRTRLDSRKRYQYASYDSATSRAHPSTYCGLASLHTSKSSLLPRHPHPLHPVKRGSTKFKPHVHSTHTESF